MKTRTVLSEMIAAILIIALSVCSVFAVSEEKYDASLSKEPTDAEKAEMIVADYYGDCEDDNVVKMVTEDLENLRSVGIFGDILTLNRVNNNNTALYDLKISNDITDQLYVEEAYDGTLNIDIFEGNIHDRLSFHPDGSIILNGNKVTISDEDIEYDDIHPESRSSVFRKTPYKGKKSNYTKYIKNYKKNSVNAGSVIKGLAAGTIATILSAALTLSLGPSIGVGALAGLGANIKSVAEAHAPDSAYLSYSVNKYEYPQKGGTDRYYRYTGKYYVKKNCSGYNTSHTFYEYNFFS